LMLQSHLVDRRLGETERQRHARAAERGDDSNVWRRRERHEGLLRMLRVDPVPALCDRPAGDREKLARMMQDQLIDLGLVERVDGGTILVRIAKRDLARRRLRYENVNAPLVELWRLVRDPLLELGKRLADLERRVMLERESAGE